MGDPSGLLNSMRIPHYTASADFTRFVRALPKTETHLHLEGSTPLELLRELEPDRFRTPPPFEQPVIPTDPFHQFPGLSVLSHMHSTGSAQRPHNTAPLLHATWP